MVPMVVFVTTCLTLGATLAAWATSHYLARKWHREALRRGTELARLRDRLARVESAARQAGASW